MATYKIITTTDKTLIGKTFTLNEGEKKITILGVEAQKRKGTEFESVIIRGDFVTLINSNFSIKGRKI